MFEQTLNLVIVYRFFLLINRLSCLLLTNRILESFKKLKTTEIYTINLCMLFKNNKKDF